MRWGTCATCWFVLCLGNLPALAQASQNMADEDRDQLTDAFEAELLVRFQPVFLVAAQDCDGQPAEFQRDAKTPQVAAKNGTLYGQVFPFQASGLAGAWIEIHYYHLWSRDCGRKGHALDAEHVSTLVRAAHGQQPATQWKAAYWYAAAHEDTVCNNSSGAQAAALQAEEHGPTVWISSGKHASFLSLSACESGCGGDRCDKAKPLQVSQLINVGEPGAPLHGSVWTASAAWPLAAKMASDFSPRTLARLHAAEVVALTETRPSVQAMVSAGNSSLGAAAQGQRHTEEALDTASSATEQAFSTAATATSSAVQTGVTHMKRSLHQTGRVLGGWMRRK